MRKFDISKNDAGQRLDKFLKKVAPKTPSSLVHKLIRKKDIKVNGKRTQASIILTENDIVEIYLADNYFATPNLDFLNAGLLTDIIYEDSNILIVNKPVGILMHSGSQKEDDTLISRAIHYLYNEKQYDPCKENSFTPAFCNRIDRNTGGLVILAKNFSTLQILNEKFKKREVIRKYICLVHGAPPADNGTIDGFYGKDESLNKAIISKLPQKGFKEVKTNYKLLKTFGATSLLEVEIITGRSHQIRAHLAFIGLPIVGDTKYGGTKIDSSRGQKLIAHYIAFNFASDSRDLKYLSNKEFQIDNALELFSI